MRILLYIATFISLVFASSDYFDILDKEFEQTVKGKTRTFYITAEEEIWDYASQSASAANVPDKHIIGTRYYKALYHEYDASFRERKARFHWQGNMGPILRAQVGDTIQIHFWNRAKQNYTMHPHGVFYEFEMEGAIFKGSYENAVVLPNHNYTYTWQVLPRAGPGPADGDSIAWGYHSHVKETDLYAGLYGAIVIYKPGKLSHDDIVTSVFVADENLSPYLSRTMSSLYPQFDYNKFDKNQIYGANQFDAINGLIRSNPSDLKIKGEVDWHLLGWGTYWDVQYIRWEHGQVWWGESVTEIRLMPASFYTVTVQVDTPGTYDFGSSAMNMEYTVLG
ncbi:hypothetical protein INT47_004602 [Mucor saturninus]|uniref:Plastocyanin-like domain-containing protein n=1 Tax=Mucor saturninus TaxID=64648 RepID=A0A8H7RJX3_9FUNG|nr:hypothetical protein INT47_004602 [Mucor saturninus]